MNGQVKNILESNDMLISIAKNFIKPTYLLIPALLAPPLAIGDNYNVISGTFFMGTVTSAPIVLVPGNNTGVLVEGTFQGTSLSESNQALFAPFPFFGVPVGTYTAQTGVDAVTHAAPTVDLLNETADMGSFYAFWNGTEFNQGSTTANVFDNFDRTYTLSWTSLIVGGPFNGKTGSWVMLVDCPACPAVEAGPSTTLTATQNSVSTHTVTQADGNVTLTTDLVSTAGYLFSWSATNDAVDSGNVVTTPTFTFDPSTVAVGKYNVTLKVTNTNTTPQQKSLTTFIIHVVATGTLADIGDTDNDGVANTADLIDNTTTPTQIQGKTANSTDYILESSAGSLSLGNIAVCADTNAAEVTLNQIKNNAGTSCTATAKATDDIYSVTSGIGGYFDVQIGSLTRGDQVDLVIPLHEPLPRNAGFRKFNNSQTPAWSPFDTTTIDSVASAPGSAGTCPAPTSTAWKSGLTQGHNCIRLSVTDAGPNDGDGFSNGVITLTGTIEGYPGIDANLIDGCSMSSSPKPLNEHLEWLIVAAFLLGLGFLRRTHTDNTSLTTNKR